ncbi:MAG: GMC family oxidoreductase N-terminal domain-containing protein [Thermomicrobiales bacterium]|nr:GMC family oxidoreductase N-terminal domain-containing protein [Thermomicrobiales bacterium]MCO5221477.1 GMC family oxidoreductase N-terminal domain-containing protein [Thermomicrobiales bacterium]
MPTTIVAGGGSAGACVAARLVEAGDEVILLEAGPDYGPFDEGNWPADLLDPAQLSIDSHTWSYISASSTGTPDQALERAKVIGGCSAHNGCTIIWSHRIDYDDWLASGLTHWSTESFLPFLRKATDQVATWIPSYDEVTPFHQIAMDTAPTMGYPLLPNLMDMEIERGICTNPVNIQYGARWNTAFAYLDPLRGDPRLRIIGNALVDRVIVRDGVAVGVEVAGPDGPVHYEADRVVLCAGGYGSPLILQRSGIADPALLAPLGIDVVHPLAGVGQNLMDHPAVSLQFTGTPALTERLEAWVADGGLLREEGTTVLAASDRCPTAFDLHLYPVATRVSPGEWSVCLFTSVMASRSTGTVVISDRDPAAPPVIDHAYFSDPEGYDLDALLDGVRIARELAQHDPLVTYIGEEADPSRTAQTRQELAELVPTISRHNYHPACSCKMGLPDDPTAVVDQDGKVLGLDGLYVVDASIMPFIVRANTNLPVIAMAEKLAAGMSMQHASGGMQ